MSSYAWHSVDDALTALDSGDVAQFEQLWPQLLELDQVPWELTHLVLNMASADSNFNYRYIVTVLGQPGHVRSSRWHLIFDHRFLQRWVNHPHVGPVLFHHLGHLLDPVPRSVNQELASLFCGAERPIDIDTLAIWLTRDSLLRSTSGLFRPRLQSLEMAMSDTPLVTVNRLTVTEQGLLFALFRHMLQHAVGLGQVELAEGSQYLWELLSLGHNREGFQTCYAQRLHTVTNYRAWRQAAIDPQNYPALMQLLNDGSMTQAQRVWRANIPKLRDQRFQNFLDVVRSSMPGFLIEPGWLVDAALTSGNGTLISQLLLGWFSTVSGQMMEMPLDTKDAIFKRLHDWILQHHSPGLNSTRVTTVTSWLQLLLT